MGVGGGGAAKSMAPEPPYFVPIPQVNGKEKGGGGGGGGDRGVGSGQLLLKKTKRDAFSDYEPSESRDTLEYDSDYDMTRPPFFFLFCLFCLFKKREESSIFRVKIKERKKRKTNKKRSPYSQFIGSGQVLSLHRICLRRKRRGRRRRRRRRGKRDIV